MSKVVYGWVETCGVSLLKSSWERRFRQEEHTAPEQRYRGFAGGASTGSRPPHGASAVRGAAAGRGGGSAEFEEHLSSFGHEKLPDGRQRVVRNGRLPEAQDSHRARRGGCAGPQGVQPLGLPRAVPLRRSPPRRRGGRSPPDVLPPPRTSPCSPTSAPRPARPSTRGSSGPSPATPCTRPRTAPTGPRADPPRAATAPAGPSGRAPTRTPRSMRPLPFTTRLSTPAR